MISKNPDHRMKKKDHELKKTNPEVEYYPEMTSYMLYP